MASIRENYDGFVSIRAEAKPVFLALRAELMDYDIRVAWQDDIAAINNFSHVDAARQTIRNTNFAVVLLTPRLLEPPAGEQRCYQKDEIIAICEKVARVAHHSGDSNQLKYNVFYVLLQDETGFPQIADLDNAICIDETINGITQQPNFFFIPDYQKKPNQAAIDTIKRIAQKIYMWTVENGVPLVAESKTELADPLLKSPAQDAKKTKTPAQDEAELNAGTPDTAQKSSPLPGLTASEADYLSRSARLWHRGRIDNLERPTTNGAHDTASGSPFEFEPQRFIELIAQFTHGRDMGIGQRGWPLSELLAKGSQKPLILQGEAGAGKTTSLTAVASIMASAWDTKLEAYCKRIAGGEWLEKAAPHINKDTKWFPVVIRCSRIAAHFDDELPDVDRFLDILAMMIEGSQSTQTTSREDLRERMINQPYALLLDGLDETENKRQAKALVESVLDLWTEITHSGQKMRVIITTREMREKYPDTEKADLKRLGWKQISQFFHAYATIDLPDGVDIDEDRVSQDARELWRTGGLLADPLKTPLLLNAFCWLEQNKGSFKGNRSEFCRYIIDYLLKNRSFNDTSGKSISAANIRKLLQRLAYEATSSELGRGYLDEEDAEAVVQFWAKSELQEKLGRSDIQLILAQLSARTGLFYKFTTSNQHTDYYSFDKHELFREYLAGERLADGDLTRQTIRLLSSRPEDLEKWEASIAFASAIRAEDLDLKSAMRLPEDLLNAAKTGKTRNEIFLWLMTTLISLTECVKYMRKAERSAFFEFIQKILNLYRQHEVEFLPAEREAFAQRLMRISRRIKPEQQTEFTRQLLTRYLDRESPWVEWPSQPGVFLSDTPVLVYEYQQFLESDYANPEYWPHTSNDEECETILGHDPADASMPEETTPGDKPHWSTLDQWNRLVDRPASPVVYVTWYEAVAYCHWKTKQSIENGFINENEQLRLPTVKEWRSIINACANGARYPWGNDSLSPSTLQQCRINSFRAEIERPSSPGVFEAYGFKGLFDFGSNIRCWLTKGIDTKQQLGDEEDARTGGGSWADFESSFFRSDADPCWQDPSMRSVCIGFRLIREKRSDS